MYNIYEGVFNMELIVHKNRFMPRLLILIIVMIGFFALPVVINQQSSKLTNDSYELLARVDNYEHALILSEKYDMTLMEVSQYQIASFSVDSVALYNDILENNSDDIEGNTQTTINRVRPIRPGTNDPFLPNQYAIPMMKVDLAWEHTEGVNDVIVAIIDTGIDYNHPEFQGKILPDSYNSRTKTVGITAVMDDNGHGTSVAGIIAATKDNGIGIAGIAPNISLLIIKANADGENTFYDSAIIEGIHYATEQGANLINLSLGNYNQNALMKQAIDQAAAQGIILVGAAGNDSSIDPVYPASYENVISVSAITATRTLASFSNFGPTIDISAPGNAIYTTGLNNTYISSSGTSVAAPQVTGVIALIMSFDSTLSRNEIIQRIYTTAQDEGDVGRDDQYGYGIINAYQSLDLLTFTVQFRDANDELIYVDEVAYGFSAYPPEDPIKESTVAYDFTFENWDTDFSEVTANLIVRPIFASHIKQYTYTFYDADGTTILHQLTADYGSIINAPSDPQKSSTPVYYYVFNTWEPAFVDGLVLEGDISFVANYTEHLQYYTITFYDADNTILQQQSLPYDAIIIAPTPPEKLATAQYTYTFDGWDQAFANVVSNMDIFPTYIATINHYKVTFIINDTILEQMVAYGADASFPTIDEELLDQFIGWDDTGIHITQDTTIHALFAENSFALMFYADEVLITELHVIKGGFLDALPELIPKPGYTAAWSITTADEITEDMDIYMIYTPIQYHIQFIDDTQSVYDTYVLYHELVTPYIYEKQGYTFGGWYFNDVLFDFSTPIEDDIVLIARFIEVIDEPDDEIEPDIPSPEFDAWPILAIFGFFILIAFGLILKKRI